MTEKVERADRQADSPPVPLSSLGTRAFLLAAVREGDRFSVVTARPNASVASIHDRMPLVLGLGESSV